MLNRNKPESNENNSLHSVLDSLRLAVTHASHLLRVWTAPYETTKPYTFGGPTGTYTLQSPFNTPCEFTIIKSVYMGAVSGILGTDTPPTLPAVTGSIDPSAALGKSLFASAAQTTIPEPEQWYPIGALGTLYLVTSGTDGLFLTVQYRRRVNPAGVYSES